MPSRKDRRRQSPPAAADEDHDDTRIVTPPTVGLTATSPQIPGSTTTLPQNSVATPPNEGLVVTPFQNPIVIETIKEYPRFVLHPPTGFDGLPHEDPIAWAEDFLGWARATRTTQVMDCMDAMRPVFKYEARDWLRAINPNDFSDREQLMTAFIDHFSKLQPRGALELQWRSIRYKKDQDINIYASEIKNWQRRLNKSDEETLLQFTQGLPEEVSDVLELQEHTSMQTLVKATKRVMATQAKRKERPKPSTGTSPKASPTKSKEVEELDAKIKQLSSMMEKMNKSTKSAETFVANPQPQPRHMTPRACYICRQTNHLQRNCPFRQLSYPMLTVTHNQALAHQPNPIQAHPYTLQPPTQTPQAIAHPYHPGSLQQTHFQPFIQPPVPVATQPIPFARQYGQYRPRGKRLPSTPCPACRQMGHWKSECPMLQSMVPTVTQQPSGTLNPGDVQQTAPEVWQGNTQAGLG